MPPVPRFVIDRLLKVFAPLIARLLFNVLVNETFRKVCPEPPAKIALLLESVIWDVPALNVRFVEFVNTIGVDALKVTVELPRFIVRVLLLLEISEGEVTLKLLVVNVPKVTVIDVVLVKASDRDQVAVLETAPKIICPNVFPADVRV